MANTISILIQAKDSASGVIKSVGDNIETAGEQSKKGAASLNSLQNNMGALIGVTASAGVATHGLIGEINDSIGSANRLQAALTGLNSVARAFNQDAGKAKQAAQDLAKDGLMTVSDAAVGLKNLLASGFSLDQAVTLMNRFKDSAAFGRQSALSFGDAISSATEGIKNGNSILVDNAGVTKNLSMMLTDAGYSAQDLMKATSDAGVREAIFNGILKETNAQAGDAARLADSAAGKQAVWSAQTEILQQKIGTALQPALLALLNVATPIITAIADWVSKNPELASGILIAVTAVTGLATIVGTLGFAIAGLGPIFAAFQVAGSLAIGGVGTAFTGLSALIASPLAMPAIAVGAALGALWLVIDAANKARDAVNEATAAKASLAEQDKKDLATAYSVINSGVASPERKAAAQRVINNINARHALGTSSAPGGATLVGEMGPEIVNMPQGAQVTPAYRTRAAATGGGGASINIENLTIANQMDEQRFLANLGWRLALR
jgi:hypothetical protein